MPGSVKEALDSAIELASTLSDNVSKFGSVQLEGTPSLLVDVLSDAAHCDLLEGLALCIIRDAQRTLARFADLVFSSGPVGCRLFAPKLKDTFCDIRRELERSASNIRWLVAVSTVGDDIDFLGLPPIFRSDPAQGLVWIEVAKLLKGPTRIKVEAAALLGSYAQNSGQVGSHVINAGGVVPLLGLLKKGSEDAQVIAAAALVALAKNRETVDELVKSGACAAFVKVLKTGPLRAKAAVFSAIADFADKYPPSQNVFSLPHNNVVRILVANLVFLGSGYIDSFYPRDDNFERDFFLSFCLKQEKWETCAGVSPNISLEERHEMEAMATKAMWKLARGNPTLCRSIIVSGALSCIWFFLAVGPERAQLYASMAFMEMSRVVEQEADLRRLAFKTAGDHSVAKDVVEEMIRMVERRVSPELLSPCAITLGCLSKTFGADQTHMIGPLVGLLESNDPEVVHEAAAALVKFTANGEKQRRSSFLDAVIREGGINLLVDLVLFDLDSQIRSMALVLLCRLALYVPDNYELASLDVLAVLRLTSRIGFTAPDSRGMDMLPVAKARLEAYQSRTRP